MTGGSDSQETSRTTRVTANGQRDDTSADTSEPDLTPVEELSPEHAILIFQRGPRAGERLPLDADRTLVGRHPGADIHLDDVTVSRRHAELLAHNDGHMVRDVGSLNGTYVNDERIDSTVLRADDELQVGKYRFTYYPATGPA